MPALSDYTAGTITLTNGLTAFTGAGTGWQAADFREGDTIFQVAGQTQWDAVIEAITDNTSGVLAEPWGGATGTYTYRMRYMADGARVTAQARNLIELLGNGNALALAGLTGPGVVVFNGPHSMVLKPEADFVNGVFFNIGVDTFADRAAYDAQPGPVDNTPGYTVLVRQDVNFDNKTTLYSKLSDTSGDWSSAAVITGPIGEMPTLEVGTTTTLNPGDDATVGINPVTGGYELDFGIPEGRGAKYVPGGYNPTTVYTLDQVALDNGSSWILTVPTSTGNAPPILPTTSNAYWSLLARAGTDGAGTGDVVGPTDDTVDNGFVLFANNTGKLIKTATAAAYTALLSVLVGDSGSGGTKGLVPAPAAGDAAAGKVLGAGGGWVVPASNSRGHLYGLTISNNATDATNDLDIAEGEAVSSDGTTLMVLASAITKRLDAAWAVGSGNGGLDTGTVGNGTYHVYLIQRPDTGVEDALFSLSATAPTLPANYTKFRRIGSILRESAVIVPFQQFGDLFIRNTAALSNNSTSNLATLTLITLNVPVGIVVEPILSGYYKQNGAGQIDLSIASVHPGPVAGPEFYIGLTTIATQIIAYNFSAAVLTDTAGQVYLKRWLQSGATLNFFTLYTQGWRDARGQL